MEKISVVINTYNAAKHLAQVIESAKGFDEILICDMESTDETVSIARAHGCRVIIIPKRDFCIVEPVRDFSIHQASHPWVLVIDADELVTPSLCVFLYSHIESNNPAEGVMIPRKNRLMGRFMHGYYPDYNLRFFKKSVTTWPAHIHAQPKVQGRVFRISYKDTYLAIEHLDDRNIQNRLTKINLYTDYDVQKRLNRHYGILAFFYRPLLRFLKTYVLKGGFRDGVPGLIFACLEAVQQFAILAKHYEYKHP